MLAAFVQLLAFALFAAPLITPWGWRLAAVVLAWVLVTTCFGVLLFRELHSPDGDADTAIAANFFVWYVLAYFAVLFLRFLVHVFALCLEDVRRGARLRELRAVRRSRGRIEEV